MVAESNPLLTRDEYLAFERRSETKHEYVAGEVVAMAGATRRHNRIQMATSTTLDNQLLNRPCEVFPSDMRVTISALGIYTYPDITVVCGEPLVEDEEEDTLLNPTVIIEILSPATEQYDRSRKFHRYQLIPSFQEYLLIAQDVPRIDHYIHQPDNRWFLTTYEHPDDVIVLPSIDCTLALTDVYRRVTFPPSAQDNIRTRN
jgi:Uma2 family endonuclease